MPTRGEPEQGYMAVIRYREDATRDECRNVAVILFSEDGTKGGMRRLHPQLPLVDAMLDGLMHQYQRGDGPGLDTVENLHRVWVHSLVITEPKPCAVIGWSETLNLLYRAYLEPKPDRRPAPRSHMFDRDTARRSLAMPTDPNFGEVLRATFGEQSKGPCCLCGREITEGGYEMVPGRWYHGKRLARDCVVAVHGASVKIAGQFADVDIDDQDESP